MKKSVLDLSGSFLCPIIGLDPRDWVGVAFVGELGGPSSALRNIQLTYLDSWSSPGKGLAICIIRWHDRIQKTSPPNWLVSFVARFEASMVEERLRSGVETPFPTEEFNVQTTEVSVLGELASASRFSHNRLPLECIGFLGQHDQKCRLVIGAWNVSIKDYTPLIHILGKDAKPILMP